MATYVQCKSIRHARVVSYSCQISNLMSLNEHGTSVDSHYIAGLTRAHGVSAQFHVGFVNLMCQPTTLSIDAFFFNANRRNILLRNQSGVTIATSLRGKTFVKSINTPTHNENNHNTKLLEEPPLVKTTQKISILYNDKHHT